MVRDCGAIPRDARGAVRDSGAFPRDARAEAGARQPKKPDDIYTPYTRAEYGAARMLQHFPEKWNGLLPPQPDYLVKEGNRVSQASVFMHGWTGYGRESECYTSSNADEFSDFESRAGSRIAHYQSFVVRKSMVDSASSRSAQSSRASNDKDAATTRRSLGTAGHDENDFSQEEESAGERAPRRHSSVYDDPDWRRMSLRAERPPGRCARGQSTDDRAQGPRSASASVVGHGGTRGGAGVDSNSGLDAQRRKHSSIFDVPNWQETALDARPPSSILEEARATRHTCAKTPR